MSMGVYIKGMEMPKDIEPGLVIEFADGIDGKRYARLYHYRHGGLTEWLEAVSVPPHGRLVDADALKESFYRTFDVIFGTEFNDLIKGLLFSAHILGNAPTVIPKDKDGESDA